MKNFTIKVNGTNKNIESPSDKPLLWVLREDLHLTGTKYGCGFGVCGACVIHLNGSPERSCQITIEECHEKEITTIEGLSPDGSHYVQKAWIDENVPQCGYCQCGQIMSTTALLDKNANPTKDEIDKVMSDNYCRCGTYVRIEKAVAKAIEYKKQ